MSKKKKQKEEITEIRFIHPELGEGIMRAKGPDSHKKGKKKVQIPTGTWPLQ